MIAELLAPFVVLLTEAVKLWREELDWKKTTYQETTTHDLQDQIDACAADGSAAAMLRAERLKQRLTAISRRA